MAPAIPPWAPKKSRQPKPETNQIEGCPSLWCLIRGAVARWWQKHRRWYRNWDRNTAIRGKVTRTSPVYPESYPFRGLWPPKMWYIACLSLISELFSDYHPLCSFWFANCENWKCDLSIDLPTLEIWQPLTAEVINIKMSMTEVHRRIWISRNIRRTQNWSVAVRHLR